MSRVSRRQFLQMGAAAAAAGSLPAGIADAMELDAGGRSYDYFRVAIERKKTAYTVSPFGKLKSPQQVFLENGRVVGAGGFLNHPATRGRSSALELIAHLTVSDPDRLLHPVKREGKRGENRWKKISWAEALKEIGKALRDAEQKHGPDSVWLLLGDDTPDAIWDRFMRTLGSASTVRLGDDGNKRAAQAMTWGEESEIPDFAHARYILNFGSNLYETFPSHAASVADGRAELDAKLVSFDPRMSMTAGLSDEWVPLIPGTDGLVALAMANVIMQEGLADTAFIDAWTNVTSAQLAAHLTQFSLEIAERESGVSAATIRRIAIEFASAKPATVFSHRGASSHANGTDAERACMLLPIITGNVEAKGGYCLPRRIAWEEIHPAPPAAKKSAPAGAGASFPYTAKAGLAKVGVLFNYGANPAHDVPAAAYWRDVLRDEPAIPFIVSVGSHMSETAALADIVLPDAMYLETNEPVSCPSSLFPWIGARTALAPAPGEVRELKVILRDIVRALDPDGGKGMQKYWDFQNPEDWLRQCVESIPQLKADGGLDNIKDYGLWPNYGALDNKTGQVLDAKGKPLNAEYGKHRKAGFATASKKMEVRWRGTKNAAAPALPTWRQAANLAVADGKETASLYLVTFSSAYRGDLAAENNKYMAEKDHQNHCLVNKQTANTIGIADGELVRVVSPVGYLVTRLQATQSIHPRVIAMARGHGHKALGRVARAQPRQQPEWAAASEDPDVHFNLWWEDQGVSPNEIMPFFADPISGSAAMACVVRLEKAQAGDRYGDLHTDAAQLEGYFKRAVSPS
jgi:thiosulfate reductase/polysulfide reductase chain A